MKSEHLSSSQEMEAQKFVVVFAIGAYPESEAFRSQL